MIRTVWASLAVLWVCSVHGGERHVAFVAGAGSHGYGSHEHFAGCSILADAIEKANLGVRAKVHVGWPKDSKALDGVDAVVLYCDGGGGNLLVRHLKQLRPLVEKGKGLGLIHYATTVPKGEQGDFALRATGGYYETNWSVNPTWTAEFKTLPDHPVARGVSPFRIGDEWYYHMRFRPDMKGVTPILTAVPPESTRQRPFGAHSGNPEVRKRTGMPEHVMWVGESADGVRGFGFTGGHVHWNWGHDDYRKVVLNAVVWIAHGDVPEHGVPTEPMTVDGLEANMSSKRTDEASTKRIQDMLDGFRKPYVQEK